MNYVPAIVARTTFPSMAVADAATVQQLFCFARFASRGASDAFSYFWKSKQGLFINAVPILHSAMISLRLVFAMVAATAIPALADEGMWLFNNPPPRQLKEKYQFEPTPQWLEHLQKASVRFNSGGSGSFVSANGLCITNHHVGADCLQKFGDEQHNYLRDGFYAKTQAEEKKCVDLELNVLMSMEDVTARINGAVKEGMTSDQAAD